MDKCIINHYNTKMIFNSIQKELEDYAHKSRKSSCDRQLDIESNTHHKWETQGNNKNMYRRAGSSNLLSSKNSYSSNQSKETHPDFYRTPILSQQVSPALPNYYSKSGSASLKQDSNNQSKFSMMNEQFEAQHHGFRYLKKADSKSSDTEFKMDEPYAVKNYGKKHQVREYGGIKSLRSYQKHNLYQEDFNSNENQKMNKKIQYVHNDNIMTNFQNNSLIHGDFNSPFDLNIQKQSREEHPTAFFYQSQQPHLKVAARVISEDSQREKPIILQKRQTQSSLKEYSNAHQNKNIWMNSQMLWTCVLLATGLILLLLSLTK